MQYITEIANGIYNLNKHLEKDVDEMCTLLEEVSKEIVKNRPNLTEAVRTSLRNHFQDIYRSLKLHLVFYCVLPRSNARLKLQHLGRLIGLGDVELQREPDENSALTYSVDPWSKLMEIVSTCVCISGGVQNFPFRGVLPYTSKIDGNVRYAELAFHVFWSLQKYLYQLT